MCLSLTHTKNNTNRGKRVFPHFTPYFSHFSSHSLSRRFFSLEVLLFDVLRSVSIYKRPPSFETETSPLKERGGVLPSQYYSSIPKTVPSLHFVHKKYSNLIFCGSLWSNRCLPFCKAPPPFHKQRLLFESLPSGTFPASPEGRAGDLSLQISFIIKQKEKR